jgi:periplasmic divalent cation tolerance protein
MGFRHMSDVVLIYSLFPNAGEAHDCCRLLLQEKLIACANRLSPAISYFRWDGEVDTTEEHPVIFKTSADKMDVVITRIEKLHRYKVPAILAWRADAVHGPFAEWVKTETSQ